MDNVSFTVNEEEIAALIDQICSAKSNVDFLVSILPRNHELYKGRGTSQVNRIRGYAIAAFEKTGLPEQALGYISEELDNSHSPYLIAAAAIAIRGTNSPNTSFTAFLIKALTRVSHKDEAISFSTYKPTWPLENYTSATREILKTLAWLGANAKEALLFLEEYSNGIIFTINSENRDLALKVIDEIRKDSKQINNSCCSFPLQHKIGKQINLKDALAIRLQDQEGDDIVFRDFFFGSFSIVAFFYTRCDNPDKCSSTVTKLAQLQQQLKEYQLTDIKIAAVTYDSGYDTAERLKNYTTNRGLQYNNQCKAFRVVYGQADQLQKYFNLQVNYSNSIVNHHSIELFILNKKGIVINEFSRIALDNDSIIAFLKKTIHQHSAIRFKISTILTNSVLPFLLLFFPKCPICWAGYLSLFGLSSTSWLKYDSNFYWLLALFAITNMIFMYRHAKRSAYYIPIALALIGYPILIITFIIEVPQMIKLISIGLIALSSLLSVVNFGYIRRTYLN